MPRRRSRFGYDDSAGGGRWSKVMRLLLGTLIACVFASTPVLSEDVYQCQQKRSGTVYWNQHQLEGGRVVPRALRAFVMKVISDTKRDIIWPEPEGTTHLTCRTTGLRIRCTSSSDAWVFEVDGYGTIHYNYAFVSSPKLSLPPEERLAVGAGAVSNGTCSTLPIRGGSDAQEPEKAAKR